MPADPEAVAALLALQQATTEAHQATKDLDAAVARAKDEIRDVAKGAARRYLAKALETAASGLRDALRSQQPHT